MPDRLPDEPIFLWRQDLLRSGLGGVAVANGHVLIGDRDYSNQFDVWRCFHADSGEPLWTYQYPAPGSLDYDNAPRATPLIEGDRAYLLGAFGQLTCIRLKDGKKIWQRHLRLEYAAKSQLVWGLCSSPLLVDGKLIVNPGADNAAWVALNPDNGKELWRVGGDRHGFASPIVGSFGGIRQLVVYDRTHLVGLNVSTGEQLWKLKPPRTGDFNVPTPLIANDQLLVMTENNATRLYEFDEEGHLIPEPKVHYPTLASDQSTPVMIDNRVYCVWSDLFCLEVNPDKLTEQWIASDEAFPETGTIITGRYHNGEARLLVIGRGGELLLINGEATDRMQILSRLNLFKVSANTAEDLLTQPAIVGDRLYLRSEDELACIQLTDGS